MKTLTTFLMAMVISLQCFGQSNVLTGTVANYGLAPQSGVSVKLTLVSPNPRVVDGIMIQRNPVVITSGTNGTFAFTNIIWGKYTLSVGTTPTDWTVNVGTNTTGTVPIGSLANSTTPAPPNPATNYYTQAQVDALVASTGESVSNYASDFYASPRPVFIREPVRPLNAAGGRTLPPMGYAPWNTFACNVSQNGLSNQMRWMINRGLREAGYTNSVSIDDGWQTNRTAEGLPMIDGTRYPLGFPWLTDWARTNGFKMTVWTPADYYNYYTNGAIAIGSCGSGFRQGSGGYEFIDLPWYVTNGFSGAKLDYFGYAGDLVATMSNFWAAAQATGVDFPIDAVGYAAPFYPALIDYCSTLRVARDIRPTWAYVQYQIDEMDKNARYQRPGFWPHPDMMVVGVTNAYGSLSTHEAVSHFGLWCIMGAPLIIGADCSTLSSTLNALLTNAAYIAIDQDPLCAQGRRVKSELVPTGDLQVWVKPLGSYNSGTNAVLLLNNSSASAYVYVYFDEIGLGTNCTVLDLTTPANRGQQTEFYREYLASHQSVLLKVTGTPRQGVTLTATPRAMLYNTMSNVFLAGTFRGDARTLTNYSTTNLIGSYVGDGSGLTGVTANTLVNAANVTNLSVWGSGPADGTRLWYMDEQLAYTAGTWYFGGGVDFSGAEVEGLVGITTTASGVPLAARGTAAQTANLFEAQDAASNVVASVSSAGVFTGNGSGLTGLNGSTAFNGNFTNSAPVCPATVPTVAVNATAGNLNGTYRYRVTYTTALGETEGSVNTGAAAPVNQQIDVSSIPTSSDPSVIGRKVYRLKAGGNPYKEFYLATNIADNVTTSFTDNVADAALGEVLKSSSSLGRIFRDSTLQAVANSYQTSFGYGAGRSNVAFGNTAIGTASLANNTNGIFNTSLGERALTGNRSGSQNSAVGSQALQANAVGTDNSAFGFAALNASLATGNSAFGSFAGATLTSGAGNTAVGYNALYATTASGGSLAIGSGALGSLAANTSGNNIAIGNVTMAKMASGAINIAIGHTSLGESTNGSYNTTVGFDSLQQNRNGSHNSVLGSAAMGIGTSGGYNSAFGDLSALYVTGSSNVCLGGYSMAGSSNVTTGNANTLAGYGSGFDLTNGSYNVVLGFYATTVSPNSSNTLNIGNLIHGTGATTGKTLNTSGSVTVPNLSVSGTADASNFVATAAASATPAFKSSVTNNFILKADDGGTWILRVGNDGTLTTVTNTGGL